jgi:hypothetical protein
MGVRKEMRTMLKMLQATERTEKKALSALNGNGGTQSLRTAQSLYRQIAALASELGRIERELRDSLAWLHDGMCDCHQCLFELRRQRRLITGAQSLARGAGRAERGCR